MTLTQLEERVRSLEQRLADLHKPTPKDPSALKIEVPKTGPPSLILWREEVPLLRLVSAAGGSLELYSEKSITLQSKSLLHLHAKNIRLESERIDLAGKVLANMRYTGPYEWRQGQPRVRLIHREDGFPVITEIRGSLNSATDFIKTYIDDSDGHWYLYGHTQQPGTLVAKVICIGKG